MYSKLGPAVMQIEQGAAIFDAAAKLSSSVSTENRYAMFETAMECLSNALDRATVALEITLPAWDFNDEKNLTSWSLCPTSMVFGVDFHCNMRFIAGALSNPNLHPANDDAQRLPAMVVATQALDLLREMFNKKEG